jgi:hypothetical protein
VVTLGMWLAPASNANGVTQLLVQLPVEAPVITAVEAVVQVTEGSGPECTLTTHAIFPSQLAPRT